MLSHGLIHSEIAIRDIFCHALNINIKRLPPGVSVIEDIKISSEDFALIYQLNVPKTNRIYAAIAKEISEGIKPAEKSDLNSPVVQKIMSQIMACKTYKVDDIMPENRS